jgi:NAD-dependent SIR2 family protein deacetylase
MPAVYVNLRIPPTSPPTLQLIWWWWWRGEGKTGLLRPSVVWFGEELDSQMLKRIHQYLGRDPVDLCIVIGTSGTVYPAAGSAIPSPPASGG